VFRRLRALCVLVLLVVAGLLMRSVMQRRAAQFPRLLVEVDGEVSAPGLYALPSGSTVGDALALACPACSLPDREEALRSLQHGLRVTRLADGSLVLGSCQERLLLGLPVDVNTADEQQLQQLPGIGPALSRAIVQERTQRGPFPSLDALQRVSGIGPRNLETLRPFLSVGQALGEDPAPGQVPQGAATSGTDLAVLRLPVDLNQASAHELEALPGIGPVRAAAIVAHREAWGAFSSPAELERVSGIGPKTVAGLEGYVSCAPGAEASPAALEEEER